MIGVAYFFGTVSGLIAGFVLCAMLMYRERTPADPYVSEFGDMPRDPRRRG